MYFNFTKSDIQDVAECKPMAAEKVLKILKIKLDAYRDIKDKNLHNDYSNYISGIFFIGNKKKRKKFQKRTTVRCIEKTMR